MHVVATASPCALAETERPPGNRCGRGNVRQTVRPATFFAVLACVRARGAGTIEVCSARARSCLHNTKAMDFEATEDRVVDVIQELFLAETAYVQDPLELQMTLSSSYEHSALDDTLTHPLVLELGLVEDVQIQVQVPYVTSLSSPYGSGMGNACAGVAVGLFNSGERGLAVTVGADAELPAPSAARGNLGYGVQPFFMAYQVLGAVHLDLSARAKVSSLGQNAKVGTVTALGAFTVVGPWVPSMELGVMLQDGVVAVQAAPGMTFIMPQDVWLGLAGILPVGTHEDYSALLSLTWESELTPPRR